MRRVLILGQGYVGLPLAMAAVSSGFDVTGLDINKKKVSILNNGRSDIEDVSDSEVSHALEMGSYRAVYRMEDVSHFDVAIISVPTPLKNGLPDLSSVESACKMVASKLRPGSLVILESTTYPGTTEELVCPILENSELEAGVDFFLGYSPERVDPGNPVWNQRNTPKIVSGINEESLHRVQEFFDEIVDTTVSVRGTREAELCKLLENTFRHINIALVNEFAMFANDLNIDIWQTIEAASTKPFGFMKFLPGPGVGGHCLPIDPNYLSWYIQQNLGMNFRFVELANDINEHMPNYVVNRITSILNEKKKSVNGSTITLLGMAYKKNVGDIRESPSYPISRSLIDMGGEVVAVDPFVNEAVLPTGVMEMQNIEAAIRGSDVVALIVDHDCFDTEFIKSFGKPVLDCRNVVPNGENVWHL